MEHSLHFILIFGGLQVGVVICFWNSLKNKNLISLKSLVILILFTFILIHSSPVGLMALHDHQTQDQTSSHPCCMPQTADLPLTVNIPVPLKIVEIKKNNPRLTVLNLAEHTLNNKSPPVLS